MYSHFSIFLPLQWYISATSQYLVVEIMENLILKLLKRLLDILWFYLVIENMCNLLKGSFLVSKKTQQWTAKYFKNFNFKIKNIPNSYLVVKLINYSYSNNLKIPSNDWNIKRSRSWYKGTIRSVCSRCVNSDSGLIRCQSFFDELI